MDEFPFPTDADTEEFDKLTEKVKFLIETCEAFIDFDDIKRGLEKQMRINARFLNIPNADTLIYSDFDVWAIIASNMAIRWAISKNIGPDLFANVMNNAMRVLYTLDMQDREQRLERGQNPNVSKGDSLDDYSS